MLSSKTVLVVDDEPDNRDIMRVIVEEIVGCQAMQAKDGQEALAAISSHKPDLILLDLMLPRLDGFQVMRILKQDERTASIPVIAITAMAQPKDKERAVAAGAVDFIDKPFDLDEVADKIRSYLNGASAAA